MVQGWPRRDVVWRSGEEESRGVGEGSPSREVGTETTGGGAEEGT